MSKVTITMAIIDIIIGALLLFGLIRGFSKGLFVEVASLVALVAGVYGAIHFSNFAAEFLENKFNQSKKIRKEIEDIGQAGSFDPTEKKN